MTKRYIVIDDERTFTYNGLREVADGPWISNQKIEYYRTSDEGLLALVKLHISASLHYGARAYVFLDHDLGGDDTIEPVVDFLLSNETGLPMWGIDKLFIHSQNPVARMMVSALRIYEPKCISLPEMVTK